MRDHQHPPPLPDGCADDRAEFSYMYRRRRPWGVTDSRAEMRTQARHLVRANWTQILRLAPRLARTGRIRPLRPALTPTNPKQELHNRYDLEEILRA